MTPDRRARSNPASEVTLKRQANREDTLTGGSVAHSRALPPPPFHASCLSVLCAARSSVYQAFPGLTIYTRAKDAWSARCPGPVIAHPPCRCWSRAFALSSLTVKDRIIEMQLGFHCLHVIQRTGGVLEQPAFSRLWSAASLPFPGDLDRAPGSWSIAVDQANFGHRVSKPTWLWFSHIEPTVLLWPSFALAPSTQLTQQDLTPGQRSATPVQFAAFLIAAASHANPPRVPIAQGRNTPHHCTTPGSSKPRQ